MKEFNYNAVSESIKEYFNIKVSAVQLQTATESWGLKYGRVPIQILFETMEKDTEINIFENQFVASVKFWEDNNEDTTMVSLSQVGIARSWQNAPIYMIKTKAVEVFFMANSDGVLFLRKELITSTPTIIYRQIYPKPQNQITNN